MIHALTTLHPLALLIVSIVGFGLGAVWYSPLLFVKAWLHEMKITPESMKENSGQMPKIMTCAFLCTVLSTIALAALVAVLHETSPLKGAELGLFVGAGLVAAREATNALFEKRSLRHFLIVAGHDVTLCVLQGALLAVWR